MGRRYEAPVGVEAMEETEMIPMVSIKGSPVGTYKKRYDEYVGQKLGAWSILGVVERRRKNGNKVQYFKARCRCGRRRILDCGATVWRQKTHGDTGCGKGLCDKKALNLIGKAFGYLTVLKYVKAAPSSGTRRRWLCRCVC